MKKIINLLLASLLLITLCGCKDNTKVSSKEEWNALFDSSKYTNVKATRTIDYGDMVDKQTIIVDGEIMYCVQEEDGHSISSYYYLSEDKNTIYYICESGKDIYIKLEETEYFEGVPETAYYDMLNTYVLNGLFFEYENVTYNKDKKCYETTNKIYDDFILNIEIYVNKDRIVKVVESLDDEDFTSTLTMTIEKYDGKISLPDLKTEIANEEEWKALFNKDKFTNVTAYTSYPDSNDYSYFAVSGNSAESYSVNGETSTELSIKNDPENDTETIYTYDENDELQISIVKHDPINGIPTFIDRCFASTVGEDHSNDYANVKKVDDKYVLEIKGEDYTKTLIYEVSNGYIVAINTSVLYANGENTISRTEFSNIGMTTVDLSYLID